MATFVDLREIVTTELRERVDRLVSAVETDDWPDFARVSRLSDGVGEIADTIAEIYTDLDQTLMRGLNRETGGQSEGSESRQSEGSESQSRRQPEHSDSGNGDVTKEELLERAREVNVQGRSSMTKDELAEAVEAEESVTKEELLERAREAEVEGRSSMTKDELRAALGDVGA